jgi:hypothetical protein
MPESRFGAAVGGDSRGGRRWRVLLAALAGVLVVTTIPVAVWAVPVRAPIAQIEDEAESSTAGETIANGRARLPSGDIVWTIRRIDVPGGEGLAVEEFPVGFVLVDEGTVTLREEPDETDETDEAEADEAAAEPTELAAGEAAVLPNGKAGTLTSMNGDAASLYEIALVSAQDVESGEAPGTVVGEPFPAPEGENPRFEFTLVGNTLSGEQEATIPVSDSRTPVFYLTTAGSAQLQAGEQVVELPAGQFALLTGEVLVRAAGDEPATFVMAAIGEETAAREQGTREGRENRAQRQREPRQRAGGGGGGGGQGQSDGAARRAARAARQAQQGQGGRGGGQGQAQQPGGPVTGGVDATATVPAPAGTPGAEPTLEPTLPAEPTIPADGTPPPAETPPVETPPVAETAVPTATVPVVETPTPEPTVPVVPTNPPVPEVPEVPGLPTVPAEETVVTESLPEETLPVEETPAAPVEEEQTTDPAAEG